jgi:hypothetical protein
MGRDDWYRRKTWSKDDQTAKRVQRLRLEGRPPGDICMRLAIAIGVMIVVVSISPANAAQASVRDRMLMSGSASDAIYKFKTSDVEIGAAVTGGQFGQYALAEWRSARGKLHGQVSFFYICDHWNVGKVSTGRPFRARDLVGNGGFGIPGATASKLVAELKQLDDQHIAYLKPARAAGGC